MLLFSNIKNYGLGINNFFSIYNINHHISNIFISNYGQVRMTCNYLLDLPDTITVKKKAGFYAFKYHKKLYRDGRPNLVHYYLNGQIMGEYSYKNGSYHREYGPVKTEYFEHRKISNKERYEKGLYHRRDGPAYIEYYENGQFKHEKWFINGNRIGYYENCPAEMEYLRDRRLNLKKR